MSKNNILLEMSLNSLLANTERGFAKTRAVSAGNVQVRNIQFSPSVQDSTLLVKSLTRSAGNTYNTSILFDNVGYVDEDARTPGVVQLKGVDGGQYNILTLMGNSTNVKVRCECLDFYYRFSVWNQRDDALWGDSPEPYVKTTDRPPVNPKKVSGACKHLTKLVKILKSRKIVR